MPVRGSTPSSRSACSRTHARRRTSSASTRAVSDRRGAREHRNRAPHGCLHALFVLSEGTARPAARLVQELAVPVASGLGSTRSVDGNSAFELDDDVELRVVDSTADIRYLVLPARPAGTETMSEQELAAMVTRDTMIGVARPAGAHGRIDSSSSCATQAGRRTTSMAVPRPGAESRLRSPSIASARSLMFARPWPSPELSESKPTPSSLTATTRRPFR